MKSLEEQAAEAALARICAALNDPNRLAEEFAAARAEAEAELASASADLTMSLRHSAADLITADKQMSDAGASAGAAASHVFRRRQRQRALSSLAQSSSAALWRRLRSSARRALIPLAARRAACRSLRTTRTYRRARGRPAAVSAVPQRARRRRQAG